MPYYVNAISQNTLMYLPFYLKERSWQLWHLQIVSIASLTLSIK